MLGLGRRRKQGTRRNSCRRRKSGGYRKTHRIRGGSRTQSKSKRSKSTRSKSKSNRIDAKDATVKCAPKPGHKRSSANSCFTDDSLHTLRNTWNARRPDRPIHEKAETKIHAKLKDQFRAQCGANNEACWLRQPEFAAVRDTLRTAAFAPEAPEEWDDNPVEWLSSDDIDAVMTQYEAAYPHFVFLGPTPINFAARKSNGQCVWNELCRLSLADMRRRGKTQIGVVFNTDPDHKPGQHWISLYVDMERRMIFFFDSAGDPAPREVTALVQTLQDQGRRLSPPIEFAVDSNEGVVHQKGNTECGMYSLFFIIHQLERKHSARYLKTHLVRDADVQKFRHKYFNRANTL